MLLNLSGLGVHPAVPSAAAWLASASDASRRSLGGARRTKRKRSWLNVGGSPMAQQPIGRRSFIQLGGAAAAAAGAGSLLGAAPAQASGNNDRPGKPRKLKMY